MTNPSHKHSSLAMAFGALAAAATGALAALVAVPRRALDPANIDWLSHDLWQVYGAWSTYLGEQHWPQLTTDSFSHPANLSIALFDPMPLLLWIAKLLPVAWPTVPFQLFGAYFVLCLALAGLFGTLLTREVAAALAGDRRGLALVAAAGGILCATVPYAMWRFTAHAALSSQWIVLVALWLQFRTRSASLGRYLAVNLPVLLLAAGINPYLTVMCCMPTSVLTLVEFAARRLTLAAVVMRLTAVAAIAASGLWLFGFTSGVSPGLDGGYGLYSMNLLGPIDSNGWAGIWRLDVPDATGGQVYEGFTYLGFGLLMLCTYVFFSRNRSVGREHKSVVTGLLLVAAVAFFFSLSNGVTLSAIHLAQVPWPTSVAELLSKFRSSGRFFWLAGYVLIPLVLALAYTRLGLRVFSTVVAGVLALQAMDLLPIAWQIHARLHAGQRYLAADLSLPANVDTATVIPPWQCDIEATPGARRGFELTGDYKQRYRLRINSMYVARTPESVRQLTCDPANWLAGGTGSADSIYLISTDVRYAGYLDLLAPTHTCRPEYAPSGRYELCIPK